MDINGKELKVGSKIKTVNEPTLLNVIVTHIFLEQNTVRIKIGCCTRKSIKIENIVEILD